MGTGDLVKATGQMVEHGYYLVFGNFMVEIFDDSSMENLVAKVSMTGNRCFPLSLKYANSVAMKAIVEESTWCWYKRFSHLNMQSLKLLQQQELVYGLPEIGNAYRIFQDCQLIVAYSPQQNGVAERKNMTIVEMSKTMMKKNKLPYKFWGEAVNTAIYIQNRCPTKALDNITPFEAFSGRKPGVKHLRVFGSIYFCHVPSKLRSKLEDAAINKITTSKSVTFDENSLWDWDKQTADSISIPMRFEDTSRSSEEESDETMIDSTSRPIEVLTYGANVDSPGDSPSSTPVKLRDITEIYARCNMSIIEPENFAEASEDKAWQKAMEIEMEMIEKNEIWELVDRPSDKPVISVKWVYKTKLNLDGSIQKHKARLVVKGYAQKPEIDFNETFAPVARLDPIRTLIAFATQKGWKL
ncbi:unnamed protein product [Prunus armeniaca]